MFSSSRDVQTVKGKYMNTERAAVPVCPPVALLLFSVELLSVSESASTGPLPCLGEWVSE